MSYAHDVNTSLLFLERVGKIENIVRSSGFFLAKKYGRQNRSTHRVMHITRGKILAVSKFVSSSKRLPPAYSANTKACIPPSQGERKSCSSQRPTYRRILSARVASPCCLQRRPFCKQARG